MAQAARGGKQILHLFQNLLMTWRDRGRRGEAERDTEENPRNWVLAEQCSSQALKEERLRGQVPRRKIRRPDLGVSR